MLQIHHDNARNIFPSGVRVYVSDLERSHQWYSQVLGLKMEMAPDGESSLHTIRYEEGQSAPVFWLVAGLDSKGRHSTVSLTFQTTDLEGTVEALKAAGVTVVRDVSLEPGSALRSATILDPDEHGIVIYEC